MTMESVHTQRFQVELCRLGRNGAPRAQHAASSRQTAQRRTTSSIERARPRHHHARGHARASSPPVCVSVRPHLRVRFLAMLPCEEGTPPLPHWQRAIEQRHPVPVCAGQHTSTPRHNTQWLQSYAYPHQALAAPARWFSRLAAEGHSTVGARGGDWSNRGAPPSRPCARGGTCRDGHRRALTFARAAQAPRALSIRSHNESAQSYTILFSTLAHT